MSTTLTARHLEIMFGQLQNCCLHDPAWTPVDVAEVLYSIQQADYEGGWKDSTVPESPRGDWKDGADSSSYTVVRLHDGRYGLLAESEDYTGHGCRCDAAASIYGSLDELLKMGIPEQDARDAVSARMGE